MRRVDEGQSVGGKAGTEEELLAARTGLSLPAACTRTATLCPVQLQRRWWQAGCCCCRIARRRRWWRSCWAGGRRTLLHRCCQARVLLLLLHREEGCAPHATT